MKTLLYGRRHGKENFEMIAGPNVTVSDQIVIRDDINKTHPVNDTWAEVHMLHSEGSEVKGRLRFLTTKQAEETAAIQAKSDVELKNSRADAEKREKEKADAIAKAATDKHAAEVKKLNEQHDAARELLSPESKAAQKIIKARADAEADAIAQRALDEEAATAKKAADEKAAGNQ